MTGASTEIVPHVDAPQEAQAISSRLLLLQERAWLSGSGSWNKLADKVTAFSNSLQLKTALASAAAVDIQQQPSSSLVPASAKDLPSSSISVGAHQQGHPLQSSADQPSFADTLQQPRLGRRVQFSGDGDLQDGNDESLVDSAEQHKPGETGRIAVQSFGGLDWQADPDSADNDTSHAKAAISSHALLNGLARLQRAVRDRPLAAMVTFPAGVSLLIDRHRISYGLSHLRFL